MMLRSNRHVRIPASTGRRVLSRDEAMALGNTILPMVRDRSNWIKIEHTARSITKVVNGNVFSTDDGAEVHLTFQSEFGSGLPVMIRVDQLHDSSIAKAIAQVRSFAPPPARADQAPPDDPDDPQHHTFNARSFLPVTLWREETSRAMDMARGDALPRLIEQLRQSQLSGSATVGCAERSVLYLYKQGLTAFSESTDCEVTVTARTPDGSASGWAGQANRDWTRISPAHVADRAIILARQSQSPVAIEPGRRTAILGPAAVGQLVVAMAESFRASATLLGQTPFSIPNSTGPRYTRVGMRVFDPRIVMYSDPADPLGGFPPFLETGGVESIVPGFPANATTWIDHGVLKTLAYDVLNAAGVRLTAAEMPYSVHMTTVPGTQTSTIDEMIANCDDGIYVNRFSDLEMVDTKTGMMTGVTRDGCFLVRNGKISKAIKNFRFLHSPFFALNNVMMIGTPERVAFGYNPRAAVTFDSVFTRWPRLPVIVPPLMIRDFNFSALTDAV